MIVRWAARVARAGPHAACAAVVRKLERLGRSGVPELLELALDRRPLPRPESGGGAGLVPPDTVGDLALDALRRLRTGGPAPRVFAWNLADGEGPSYEEALEGFRAREIALARAWWNIRRAETTR